MTAWVEAALDWAEIWASERSVRGARFDFFCASARSLVIASRVFAGLSAGWGCQRKSTRKSVRVRSFWSFFGAPLADWADELDNMLPAPIDAIISIWFPLAVCDGPP